MHFRRKLNAQASTAFTSTVTHWLPLILLMTNSAICVVTVWLMQSWCMQAKQNESKYTGTSSNDLKDNAFSSKSSHDSGFGSKSSSFGEQPYTFLSTLCQMINERNMLHLMLYRETFLSVMCHGSCVMAHVCTTTCLCSVQQYIGLVCST